MAEIACREMMELLTLAMSNPILMNHERQWTISELKGPRSFADVAADFLAKAGKTGEGELLRRVLRRWPAEHQEFVRRTVTWAFEHLPIPWTMKLVFDGDGVSDRVITSATLVDDELRISFLHPPIPARA